MLDLEVKTIERGPAPFPSLPALRARHAELLARYRASNGNEAFWDEVEEFLGRARATGARLESTADRGAAQAILNVWSNNLYRARGVDADAELIDYDPGVPHDLSDDEYPYTGPGLRGAPRRAALCGRDRLVHGWAERLGQRRLLAVVAPPDSGKTSLVMDGLIPLLKSGQVVQGSDQWRYSQPINPGPAPLARLAGLLRPRGVDDPDWDASQAELMRKEPDRVLRLAAESGEGPLVLVIDGFDRLLAMSDADTRRAFAACLAALATADPPEPRHTVILSACDSGARWLEEAGPLCELIEAGRVTIPPPDAGELREAILRPAAEIGLRFEEGVVDALVHDLVGDPFALPLLQFTLRALWRERRHNVITWDAYRRVGGGRLAVRRAVDNIYEGLSREEQGVARAILLQLIRPEPGGGFSLETVPRDTLVDALARAGEPRDRIIATSRRLIEAGLIRESAGLDGRAVLTPAHGLLAQCWPPLIAWLDEQRQERDHRGRLTVAARHWEESGRTDDALWRGILLDEAQSYDNLSELEEAFVKAAVIARTRRQQVRVVGLSVAVSVLVVLLGVANYHRRQAELNKKIAEIRQIAARSESVSRDNWALLLAGTALDRAKELGQSEIFGPAYAEGRCALLRALNRNPRLDRYAFTPPEPLLLPIAMVCLSPDGRLLAAAAPIPQDSDPERNAEESDPDMILIWHADDQGHWTRLDPLKGHSSRVISLAFSHDGTLLASGGRVPAKHESGTTAGERMGEATGEVFLWDLSDPKHPKELARIDDQAAPGKCRRLSSPVARLAFPPQSNALLAIATRSIYEVKPGVDPPWKWTPGQIELWDVSKPSKPSPVGEPGTGHMLPSEEAITNGLAFSPDGKQLVSGGGAGMDIFGNSSQGEIVLWDVETFEKKRIDLPEASEPGAPVSADRPSRAVTELAFAPDHRNGLIAAGTSGGPILLIDADSREMLKELTGHQGPIRSLAFHRLEPGKEALILASGSADTDVKLWDVTNTAEAREIEFPMTAHIGSVQSLRFDDPRERSPGATAGSLSDAGLGILSADTEPSVIRSRVAMPGAGFATRSPLSPAFARTYKRPQALAYTRHGIIATASADVAPDTEGGHGGIVVQLWKEPDPSENGGQPGGHGPLAALRSPGGLESLGGLEGRCKPVFSLAFVPGGRVLVASDAAGNILIWDVDRALGPNADRRPISVTGSHEAHDAFINDLVAHPGLPLVASCGDDKNVYIWDIRDPARPRCMPGELQHQYEVVTAAFCPDRDRSPRELMATSDWDRTIKLWDRSKPDNPVAVLRGHSGVVRAIDFSPDGQLLASGDMNGVVLLWDIGDIKRPEHGPPLRRHQRPVRGVKFCPGVFQWPAGRWLVSASEGEATSDSPNLLLWNVPNSVRTLPVPSVLSGHSGGVNEVAFRPLDPSGSGPLRIASIGDDSTLRLWPIDLESWLHEAHRIAGRSKLMGSEREAIMPEVGGGTSETPTRHPSEQPAR
jgi:WD40 repeat protein